MESSTIISSSDKTMFRTFGKISDIMYDGVDFESLEPIEDQIIEMKEKHLLPRDYSVHSTIQLIPNLVDTTNRKIVIDAKKDGFDPEGFRQGKPLQKSLFYMNPYITCTWFVLLSQGLMTTIITNISFVH
jgi:hypothetical protein